MRPLHGDFDDRRDSLEYQALENPASRRIDALRIMLEAEANILVRRAEDDAPTRLHRVGPVETCLDEQLPDPLPLALIIGDIAITPVLQTA